MVSDDEIERLEQALAATPDETRILHELATRLIRAGRSVEAAARLYQAALLHAAGADALVAAGGDVRAQQALQKITALLR